MVEQKHGCEAVMVSCMDYRLREYLNSWAGENLEEGGYDYVSLGGSTKDLPTVLKQIDIAVNLHHIQTAHLIHHEDCGAYGAESTPEKHAEDLRKAKGQILEKYPDLKVNLYYLHLDGKFDQIP